MANLLVFVLLVVAAVSTYAGTYGSLCARAVTDLLVCNDKLIHKLFHVEFHTVVLVCNYTYVRVTLNGIHQLLVYADDVNILGGSVRAIKKNTEALVVASKEIGLEVNAEKAKYMVMARDQNAGQNHNIKIDNKSFERVEQFKYLGTALTNRNSIQE
jgi:hypothetical protein